ncbi:MAG: methionine adenosyltransferase [Nanobdellota archaeon]
MSEFIFTSESVTEGHPDKVCDQVSDAILDKVLEKDPESRVAIETMAKTGFLVVAGELTTNSYVDIQDITRQTIKEIGYDNGVVGFNGDNCGVLTSISEQSNDIAQGVDDEEQGAGDQGMMFGYATDETEDYMPLPINLAHKITERLSQVRKERILDYLFPDGKSQVSVRYVDGKPQKVTTVVVSCHHKDCVTQERIREDIIEKVIKEACGDWLSDDTEFYVNPTGKFVTGGPVADAGLTGRKIIVDTYGGMGRHGGGAFSGKDPSKVDRSGAYAARYIAKNLVAAGLASKCEVQLSYAIGVAEPISVMVDTFGTGQISNEELVKKVRKVFPLKPEGIIEHFGLKRPIFRETSSYGHFGRVKFPWEKVDKVDELK